MKFLNLKDNVFGCKEIPEHFIINRDYGELKNGDHLVISYSHEEYCFLDLLNGIENHLILFPTRTYTFEYLNISIDVIPLSLEKFLKIKVFS